MTILLVVGRNITLREETYDLFFEQKMEFLGDFLHRCIE